MAENRGQFGSVAVPAAAAFVTCFAIGVGFSALMGVPMNTAVPAGVLVSTSVVLYVLVARKYRHRAK